MPPTLEVGCVVRSRLFAPGEATSGRSAYPDSFSITTSTHGNAKRPELVIGAGGSGYALTRLMHAETPRLHAGTAGPLPSAAPVPTSVESSDAVASMADSNSSAATAAEAATAEAAEGPTSSAAAGRRPSAARIAFAAAAACTLMHAAVAF